MNKIENQINKIEKEIYTYKAFLKQIEQEQIRIGEEILNLFKDLNEEIFDIQINTSILNKLNFKKNKNIMAGDIKNNIFIKEICIKEIQKKIINKQKEIEKLNKNGNQTNNQLNNLFNKYRTLITKQYFCNKGDILSLKDIILNPENKIEINELIDQYKDPDKYKKYGISKPKGIIFHGQKKVGKSLIVRSLGKELGCPVYSINIENIMNRYNQNENLELNNIFDGIQNNSIVFFDEIGEIIEIFGGKKIVIDTISNYIKKNNYLNTNIVFIISTSGSSKLDKEITNILSDYKLFDKQINFKPLGEKEISLLLNNINKQYNLNFDNKIVAHKLILSGIQEPGIIENIIQECFKNTLYNGTTEINTEFILKKIDSYKMKIKINTGRAGFI